MSRSKKINLLVLFPLYFWERKMSMVRRHVIDHLMERDDLNVVISGQGWKGYDIEKPLRQNITSIMPETDAIFWYKPLGAVDIPALKHLKDRSGIPAVASYNEMHWPNFKALRECQRSDTTLVIAHHHNDIPRIMDGDGEKPDLVHIPHCANPALFTRYAKPWQDRQIDVLVTGAMSQDIYPIRTRIAELVKSGAIRRKIRPHPGYRLASMSMCIAQEKDYAKELGNSKIAVVCSSKYKYGLAKYVEAAQAGCLLLGDKVPDFQSTLNPFILGIDENTPDGVIVKMVDKVLNTPEVFAGASREQQKAACTAHSVETYGDRFVAALSNHLSRKVA